MAPENGADLRDIASSYDQQSMDPDARGLARPATAAWAVAAVFAVCALAESLVIARLAARPPVVVPAVVPITLESPDPGDRIIIDGKQIGLTPLEVKLTPAMRSIRVESRSAAPPAADESHIVASSRTK